MEKNIRKTISKKLEQLDLYLSKKHEESDKIKYVMYEPTVWDNLNNRTINLFDELQQEKLIIKYDKVNTILEYENKIIPVTSCFAWAFGLLSSDNYKEQR